MNGEDGYQVKLKNELAWVTGVKHTAQKMKFSIK